MIPYVNNELNRDADLQRFLLALILATALAFAVASLLREARRFFNLASGETAAGETGSAMQKASFFLLLILIVYVAFSGAS